MRYTRTGQTNGIVNTAAVIAADLRGRDTGLHRPHIKGLAALAASMLACRSVNTSELLMGLPRETQDPDSRFRYINRLLKNPLIDPWRVQRGFVPQLAAAAAAGGQTVVLMMDQSKISNGFECLMVAMRLGGRAIPLLWKIQKTGGPIGFDLQKPLLDTVGAMLSELANNAQIMLAGDRFYGTAALIQWCQNQHWGYRLRLKDNLILQHEGGEITTGDAVKANMTAILNAELNKTGVKTHIGILHEKGHKEPWIIAMSDPPTKERVLDYEMRWGIECMFSDLKSRGFGITQTHLKHADRIERLMLIMTIALYWAVSTGMQPPKKPLDHTKKKPHEA
jgi:hypothetical protein